MYHSKISCNLARAHARRATHKCKLYGSLDETGRLKRRCLDCNAFTADQNTLFLATTSTHIPSSLTPCDMLNMSYMLLECIIGLKCSMSLK